MGLELDGPVPQHCVCDIAASVAGNLFCHQHMLHLFGGIFFLVAWNKKYFHFDLSKSDLPTWCEEEPGLCPDWSLLL